MPSTNRFAGAVTITAIVVGVVIVATMIDRRADADIEGTVFSSKDDNVRVTLPRGWRVADQPSYPGIILRMNRTRPRGSMLLASGSVSTTQIAPGCKTRAVADSGSSDVAAQQRPLPLEMQIACTQRTTLDGLGFEVGPIKEAQRPWFDYGSKDKTLRQGVVLIGDRVFTLVLSTETAASRAQYARTFDSMLLSIRALEAEDDTTDAGVVTTSGGDAGVDSTPGGGDAGVGTTP